MMSHEWVGYIHVPVHVALVSQRFAKGGTVRSDEIGS